VFVPLSFIVAPPTPTPSPHHQVKSLSPPVCRPSLSIHHHGHISHVVYRIPEFSSITVTILLTIQCSRPRQCQFLETRISSHSPNTHKLYIIFSIRAPKLVAHSSALLLRQSYPPLCACLVNSSHSRTLCLRLSFSFRILSITSTHHGGRRTVGCIPRIAERRRRCNIPMQGMWRGKDVPYLLFRSSD